MSDYLTDLKSVLDQALRVLQAMVDIASDGGWLCTALGTMRLTQMVSQGRFLDGPQLLDLPHMSEEAEAALARRGVRYLPQLMLASPHDVASYLKGVLSERQLAVLLEAVSSLPAVEVEVRMYSEVRMKVHPISLTTSSPCKAPSR